VAVDQRHGQPVTTRAELCTFGSRLSDLARSRRWRAERRACQWPEHAADLRRDRGGAVDCRGAGDVYAVETAVARAVERGLSKTTGLSEVCQN
jgi:hypothetical protein